MLLEMFTGGINQSVPVIILELLLYTACAFAAFMIHDLAQVRCAKRHGDADNTTGAGLITQAKNPHNWLSVLLFLVFGIAYKRHIPLTRDIGRKRGFWVALYGPLWCFISAVISYILIQLLYLLDETSLSFLPQTLVPVLYAFFGVLIIIGVFSLFILPPFDGGHMLAAIAPYETRDKLLELPEYVGLFVFVIAAVIFARLGYASLIIEKVYYAFNFVWQHIGTLIVYGG